MDGEDIFEISARHSMNIFLTGGTGFVGSHFINKAHEAGHTVTALRRSESSRPSIPLAAEPVWINKTMPQLTAEDFKDIDSFVHLAAHGVTPQPSTWESAFRVNLTESLAATCSAIDAGVANFAICGSCVEYGTSAVRYEEIPSDAPLEPIGPYAASKAAFTIAVSGLCREKNVRVSVLRLFHLFGEGQFENNFWPSLRFAALSGQDFKMTPGEQIRDFCAVEHAAQQILRAVTDGSAMPGKPRMLNIGSGKPTTLREFAEHWWSEFDAAGDLLVNTVPYRAGEVMRYVPKLED